MNRSSTGVHRNTHTHTVWQPITTTEPDATDSHLIQSDQFCLFSLHFSLQTSLFDYCSFFIFYLLHLFFSSAFILSFLDYQFFFPSMYFSDLLPSMTPSWGLSSFHPLRVMVCISFIFNKKQNKVNLNQTIISSYGKTALSLIYTDPWMVGLFLSLCTDGSVSCLSFGETESQNVFNHCRTKANNKYKSITPEPLLLI